MVKLKKRLNNDQRVSLTSKRKVAKLTPDEIRSLNHSASVSKSGSIYSINVSAQHGTSPTVSGSTPPLTPDNQSLSHQLPPQRRSSVSNLPSPPQSPSRERRGSNSSGRHIHAPRPVSHVQAAHLTNNGVGVPRSPSANSYRGVETYRGPEMTRSGSLTTLQRPQQQIVANPLSQFSRPRQSTLTTSPTRSRSGSRGDEETIGIPSIVNQRRPSREPAISQLPSREQSPVRVSDSPVSFEERKMPGLIRIRSKEQINASKPVKDASMEDPERAVQVKSNDTDTDQSETASKHKSWRRTLTGSFDKEPTPLKKEARRRTLMAPKNGYCLHAINYADVKPGNAPEMRNSLRDELPSTKTSVFKGEQNAADAGTEYGQHPAVRPFSIDGNASAGEDASAPSLKGKQREDAGSDAETDALSVNSSVPSYSRCSCCGRIQKQGGFDSDLSPVLENENLRTNFNFEAEKTGPNPRRRSSSIQDGPRRYTPIIPMEVGNTTKQARIDPMPTRPASIASAPPAAAKMVGVAINKPGDVIGPGSTPLAIMPRKRTDPRLSRFGSLHARLDDFKKDDSTQEKQPKEETPAPPPQLTRFGSLYGQRNSSSTTPEPQAQAAPQNQSAYQAQQVRHYSLPIHNDYRPVRSSRLASYDGNTTTPAEELTRQLPGAFPLPTASPVFEKPLQDSPRSQEPEMNISDDSLPIEGEPVYDLSSFDGSFVDNSISRSATIAKVASPHIVHNVSSTSSRPQVEANTSRVMAPAPAKIDITPVSYSAEDHSGIGQAITTPTPGSAQATSNIHPSTSDSSNLSRPSTTVVRIIPSAPLSATSSVSSATGGPLKLGDWVLPESPRPGSDNTSIRDRDSVVA